MRRGLPIVVWAVAWTAVVALATLGVWTAISRAGAHGTSQAALKVPASTITPTPPATTPGATPQATPRPTPRPSSRPTTRPTTRPTSRPSASGTRTAGPAPVAVQGSWSGPAGRVTATCRAQRIRLDAAVPADGFTVEIGDRGPETLEVEFKQNQGDREVSVKGSCRSDGPRFTVEQD